MKEIIKSVTKITKILKSRGFTLESEDNCESSLTYHTINGYELVIGDDNEREQWCLRLEKIKSPTGTPVTHQEMTEILIGVLGPQTKQVTRTDLDHTINNWNITKKFYIVHEGDSIEFFQDYTKR
jgi:hypothetical protein